MDETLVRDWVTIWQSELGALAEDPELATHMAAVLRSWLTGSAAWRFRHEFAVPGTDAPPRAAAPAAAPDAGQRDEGSPGLAELARRLAELERRFPA